MNHDAYVAQAAALQVAAVIQGGDHFFCERLPNMDVDCFLTALAREKETSDAAAVSLALVGYGVSDTDLRDRLRALGLAVGHVTTDLHIAARWRNQPDVHSQIIALATGSHPGVSTLAHFPQGESRVIAGLLLQWAQSPQAGLAATRPQRILLHVLENDRRLLPLVSLSGVAEFLATWQDAKADDELGAPRIALPRLGVLPDRNLLSASNEIAARLLSNFKLTQEVVKMNGSRLEDIRQRVKRRGRQDQLRGLDVLNRTERIRVFRDFDAYSQLDFEDARAVFQPSPQPTTPGDDPDEPQPSRPRNSRGVARDAAELLIDGAINALDNLAASIQESLTDAVDGDEDSANGYYEIDGDERQFEINIERELLTWVHFFCSADAWGGFYEAPTGAVEDAIRDYSQYEPTSINPVQRTIVHDGQRYDLRSLIEPMQQELSDHDVTTVDLCGNWDRIVVARDAVLGHLDIIIHQPMLALAGQPSLRDAVTELLQAWERFYAKLAQHHAAMHEIDHAWTRLLFEAVASLDVVQIRTNLGSDRTSWKAVLLPTHPLHLWRYERFAALANSLNVEGIDRAAVIEQLQKPEHYLGVIYLTSLPEGRGGSQPLPVARDYGGLAVFENLRNSYSGDDGVDSLQYCVRQFAQIYVNHACPLRLALINPPNASGTLVTLLGRSRGRSRLTARLLVDIYATPGHESRLLGARRFSTEDRDQIEEHIAAGRLQLRVNDDLLTIGERLQALRDRPVHIVAVFDEATTAMRHQPAGANLLPMSPFAIRRRISFQGIQRKVELLPSHEESVFRSFYDMVGKIHGARPSETPQASADAEIMAEYVDSALTHTSPAAFWFFFADRSLPSPGRVSVARILERHDGRRRSVCYDASYERLALLLRPSLDQFNGCRSRTDWSGGMTVDGLDLIGERDFGSIGCRE